MFRWIKKKCQRKKIELFRPEQLVHIQEAEYHIYEEIIDLDFTKNTPAIPAHCQCWLQRDIGQSYTCVCSRRSEEPSANVKRSKSVSNADFRNFKMDISKRPLPKLPSESDTCCENQRDDRSDASSGYYSNSVSSLTLEYDFDMLEKLEDLYLDDLQLNSMRQKYFIGSNTLSVPKSSTPKPVFSTLPRISASCSPIDNSLLRNNRNVDDSLVENNRCDHSFTNDSLLRNNRPFSSNTNNSLVRNSTNTQPTYENSLVRNNRTITINQTFEPCETGAIIWSSESIYL